MGNQQTIGQEKKKTNAPVKKFRAGAVSATVWKNETTKDNQTQEYFTVAVQRSYKDNKDQWQNTSQMRTNDLPAVILVCTEAYKFLKMAGEKDNESDKDNE